MALTITGISITQANANQAFTDYGGSGSDYLTLDNTISIFTSISSTGSGNALVYLYAFNGTSWVLLNGAGTTVSATVDTTQVRLLNGTIDVPDGTYSQFAVSTSNVFTGTEGTFGSVSPTQSWQIDHTIPGAPVITGITSDTGPVGSDGITNDTVINVSGTSEPLALISLYRGATFVWGGNADGTGHWSSANVTLPADGIYDFSATQTDRAGNPGTASGHFQVTLDTVAPAAPAITGISPDTGSNTTDGVTSAATVSVSGTAEANASVSVYNGVTLVGTTTANGSGAWTLGGVTLGAGANNLSAKATDLAGNVSASSATYVATLDTSPPTITDFTVAGADYSISGGEEDPLVVTGTVNNLGAGGTVLVQIFQDGGPTPYVSMSANVVGTTFTANFTGSQFPSGHTYSAHVVAADLAGNETTSDHSFISTVCFLAGTMIRTPAGETAVEKLAIGDLVATADGTAKPVKFIGRQTVSLIFADKLASQPICIKAGALAENVPSRDLYTSPGHAMILDGNMVIAGALVNGRSVVRWERAPKVFTYFHVELDEHCVIFANGAATESYCDNIDRAVFDNGRAYAALYPDAKPIVQMDLPHVKSARQLPTVTKRWLAARADAIAGAMVAAA